jgi:general secretion pathway protein E
MTPELSSQISRRAGLEELSRTAFDSGFHTMFTDGMDKVERGQTSMTEVLRVTREAATDV